MSLISYQTHGVIAGILLAHWAPLLSYLFGVVVLWHNEQGVSQMCSVQS